MPNFPIPRYRLSKEKVKGMLYGAEIIAIEQAERYNTKLAIMRDGAIVHITPQEARDAWEKRRNS